jgi:hypothetical protein
VKVADAIVNMVCSEPMEFIPSDPTLKQFLSDEDFGQMGETFDALAASGKNITRLPRKDFDRKKILRAFDEAFELIGGVPRLAIWAHSNLTEFYKLYTKMMPASSQLEIAGKISHTILPALPPSALDGDDYGPTSTDDSAPRRISADAS